MELCTKKRSLVHVLMTYSSPKKISLMAFSGYIMGHVYVAIKLITKLTKMLSP